MDKAECYFCEKEKEIGTELFWCPRLRTYVSSQSYYGHWVCLDCCRTESLTAVFDKHLKRCWNGNCGECDFPIGAILHIQKMFDKPTPRRMIVQSTKIVREGIHSKLVIEAGKFVPSHSSFFNHNLYYGFKWNHHFRQIELIPREILDGIAELVLRKKKLPTRKVIMLEDTTTYGPLSWGELRRYYWSECRIPQHFKEEKWMDDSIVIITSGYLNKDGLKFDESTRKRIEYIKKKELGDEIENE